MKEMRYHVAYYLHRGDDRMVVAEVLDFRANRDRLFLLAAERYLPISPSTY
jgi:hypothetical protein